jgi:hypothetical protein
MSEREEPEPPSMREVGERMREDVYMLRDAAGRRRDELLDQGRRFVDQHPLAAVGIAFGLGYLISGALLSRTTGKLLRLGARFYLRRLLHSGIGQLVGAPVESAT